MNKYSRLWMGLVLVLALILGGFQAPVKAAEAANEGTISVIGNDPAKPILEETTVQLEQNETASDMLVKTLGESNVGFTHYSFGDMVTGIGGLNADDSHFWAFYVNGEMSMTGSGDYVVQAGDRISFQYESFGNAPGDGTDGSTTPGDGAGADNGTCAPESATFSKSALKSALDSTSKYVLKQPIGDWEAIALKQAGQSIPAGYLVNVRKTVKDAMGKFRKITDTERYSLGILAAGGDPQNVEGYNLIAAIYNGDVTKQGLNGVAYALIALDSANFQVPGTAVWTREKLVQQLLDKQNPDGGWTWDVTSTISDIDTTGMVLTALAPYKEQSDVKDKITAALTYMKAQFDNGKIDNSSTAAQVIIALSGLGLDANGTQFTKENQSLMQFLLTYQNADGGFDYQGGNASDPFSTTQAYLALAAYKLYADGKGGLYQMPLEEQKPVNIPEETGTKQQNQLPSGHPLPETASNNYNLITAGMFIILIGTAFIFIQRRRVKN